MNHHLREQEEWLETDGLGGFSSGTVGGIRTRRYHGLLMCATSPPTGRYMLVNGVEVLVTTPVGVFPLSSPCYLGQIVAPDGFKHITSFRNSPWPTWRFGLPDGTVIEHEVFLRHGEPTVSMAWRVLGVARGVSLSVRPLLSGRDYHALHHENPAFCFEAESNANTVRWRPYQELPAILAQSNGEYRHEPLWYRRFYYHQEWLRGFDATEDLAAPGLFQFDLSAGDAELVFSAEPGQPVSRACLQELRAAETNRRDAFASPLHRAADQYLVKRGNGKTIIAGYPWFADWGRDTFISLRGLCLTTGRLDEARQILLSWANHVNQGMLPNRFPDAGDEPEYNSVDASLWYIISVCEFIQATDASEYSLSQAPRTILLLDAIDAILNGYAKGTRHGIRLDSDGLLSAGERGVQLTWMDARVGQHVVTPRIGKPVEIQALWLNAILLASKWLPKWEAVGERGAASFRTKFLNPKGYLYDVIDDDHRPGVSDASFRPNQIFAVGGLPIMLVDQALARRIVDQVEQKLLTPLGLRSLAPGENGYCAHYSGGPDERDGAYHQGTVWPWLIGPFVEAWVRVRGSTAQAKREARQRFIEPILNHLDEAGLSHVSEIADAEAPHLPRGCPFQAWSVAELLRLEQFLGVGEQLNLNVRLAHPNVL